MSVSQSELDVERSEGEGMGSAQQAIPSHPGGSAQLGTIVRVLEERTRERPLQALGIAAAFGMVLGLLMGGRFGRQLIKFAAARTLMDMALGRVASL